MSTCRTYGPVYLFHRPALPRAACRHNFIISAQTCWLATFTSCKCLRVLSFQQLLRLKEEAQGPEARITSSTTHLFQYDYRLPIPSAGHCLAQGVEDLLRLPRHIYPNLVRLCLSRLRADSSCSSTVLKRRSSLQADSKVTLGPDVHRPCPAKKFRGRWQA
jgi:hypothetical protein